MEKPPLTPTRIVSALLVVYVAIRTALLPDDLTATTSFLHDSGYIGIVARNLLAGHGYVNDANWLLFLNPPSLPMYFHNANPLYPTLVAGVMAITRWDPARAGAFLSLVGSALMGYGAYWLVRRFRPEGWAATACALLVILFPANWRISHVVLPDALATGLLLVLLAVIVHATKWWHWGAAGALFGLAWLTRSSATLVVPGIAVWMLWRQGLRSGLVNGAIVGAVALVVALPWLVHTARVRGGPFKSDASYYWLINYHAARTKREVDQYYRSLEPPPPTATVLREDAAGLARMALHGIPDGMYRVAAGLAEWDKLAFVLLALAMAAGALALPRAGLGPELAAAALIWVATFGALTVRARDIEIRYFSAASSLLAMLPATTLGARRRWLALLPLPWLALAVLQDARITREVRTAHAERVAQRDALAKAAAMAPAGTAMVSSVPYFATYHTGRQSVSPPFPDKAALLTVMGRYHASIVILPTDSLSYYYPGSPGVLAPEFDVEAQLGRYTVLRRRMPTE